MIFTPNLNLGNTQV